MALEIFILVTNYNIFTFVRDHFFDSTTRKRVKSKRKSGEVSVPDLPARGQRGVRQYHACDESKILAHYRRGLSNLELKCYFIFATTKLKTFSTC